jgi:23S rRNA (adenine2503-C2)-methyltransferase
MATDMKTYLAGLDPQAISAAFPSVKSYRSGQLFAWLHRPVLDFNAMSDLPLEFRALLAERAVAVSSHVVERKRGGDGSCKYKIRLEDGAFIESVLLSDAAGRNTACLSTQVGCALGCAFCATARMGFQRNLAAHEIVEQYLLLKSEIKEISHIVFMGMGEPLLNLEQVRTAINVLHHPGGSGISLRRMTISTSGLPKEIYDLAGRGPHVRLALSLITADPVLRRRLMPGAGKTPLPELQEALKAFQQAAGKRITIELILLPGVNDRQKDLDLLKKFAEPLRAVINVIPWNGVEGLPFREPGESETADVIRRLKKRGLHITQRYSKGRGINAACGQLCVLKQDAEKQYPGPAL